VGGDEESRGVSVLRLPLAWSALAPVADWEPRDSERVTHDCDFFARIGRPQRLHTVENPFALT